MKRMNSNLFLIVTLFLLFTPSWFLLALAETLAIYPPEAKPFGLSFSDHAINYWRWLISIPADQAPFDDTTGERCSNGQLNSNSSVFYLTGVGGGGKESRICEVPEGKGIFIMTESSGYSKLEKPGYTLDELKEEAKKDVDKNFNINLTIDGHEYTTDDLQKYRVASPVYNVTFPLNPIFGISIDKPTITQSASNDIFVITHPITKGNHIIHLVTHACDLAKPECGEIITRDLSYTLVVK